MTDEKTLLERLSIPQMDMRAFTRRGPTLTRIFLPELFGRDHLWITTGRFEVLEPNRSNPRVVKIGSRLGRDATDYGHDSAWAFKIPVAGFAFKSAYQSIFEFDGWIATPQREWDEDDMRLPDGNPFDALDTDNDNPEEGGAHMCDCCEEPHPIVRYLPENNPELNEKLYGRRIIVKTGYKWET